MNPLSPEAILEAYAQGYFPMGDPRTGRVEWYRPSRRGILPLDDRFHCSRRLAKKLRSGRFEIASDRDFPGVIDACADRPETWITPPVRSAYLALHRRGDAHSVEAWREARLAGGLYGVRLRGAFMAESMFHRETDAGKACIVALVHHLRRRGFQLLDIQMRTHAVLPFGALEISNSRYLRLLEEALSADPGWRPW